MFTKIFTSFALVAMCLSCSPKYVKPSSSGDSPAAADAKVEFALDFFRTADQTVSRGENLILSPYSAAVALSMLEEGAEGQTKAEFDDLLNGCLYPAEDLGGNKKVQVTSANSMWISDNFSVRNRYVSLLEKDYDTFVTTQNFSDPATVKAINNWCSENTAGKINEIIDELSPNDVMVLINALYFNAPWAEAFDKKNTFDAMFHGAGGDRGVKMMANVDRYEYGEYQGAQVIRLPYQGDRYSMTVILPPSDLGVDAMLSSLSGAAFEQTMGMLSTREVTIRLPKFRLETSLVLDKTLQKMGLRTAYSSAADFKGISESGPLSLGTVKQKCYIDVTEEGTEAAAVTSAQIRLTSVSRPTIMTVDRPFLFFISDSQTNNILFMGKIVNL